MTGRTVAVVGGGIAGLTAALELVEAGHQVTVVEGAPRCGGKIATHTGAGGLVVEAGADSFLSAKPAGLALCTRLGLDDRLIDSRPDRRTFVWWDGRLRGLPEGLVLGSPARAGALLRSGLLSPAGAARMAGDLVVRAAPPEADESIAAFFTRRLGPEAYERVVEPLLAGIHAGDATQLSLRAAFPRFAEMERSCGGMVRAARAERRRPARRGPSPGAGHTPFVSLRTGMGELVEALVRRLEAAGTKVLVGSRAMTLAAAPGGSGCSGWSLRLSPPHDLELDAVVLATPAFVSAELLRPICPDAAALLAAIPHAGTATVSLAYDDRDIGRRPEGFGFVVPRAAGKDLIAATYSSQKWPGRAPPGQTLVRGYVGGTGRSEVVDWDDTALIRLVEHSLADLAGIDGEPLCASVHRFPAGMPQYTLGHGDRVARIRADVARHRGLAVTGAAYGGVGIPDCIADASAATATLTRSLATSAP
ncbi:MAG: protoporphyrinogen oxidase [Acidimicrobiia bacterium]